MILFNDKFPVSMKLLLPSEFRISSGLPMLYNYMYNARACATYLECHCWLLLLVTAMLNRPVDAVFIGVCSCSLSPVGPAALPTGPRLLHCFAGGRWEGEGGGDGAWVVRHCRNHESPGKGAETTQHENIRCQCFETNLFFVRHGVILPR